MAQNLGDDLREIRKSLGLNLRDLSSRSGLKISVLEDLENNVRRPSSNEIISLAQGLGAASLYLLRKVLIGEHAEEYLAIIKQDLRSQVFNLYAKDKSKAVRFGVECADRVSRFFPRNLETTAAWRQLIGWWDQGFDLPRRLLQNVVEEVDAAQIREFREFTAAGAAGGVPQKLAALFVQQGALNLVAQEEASGARQIWNVVRWSLVVAEANGAARTDEESWQLVELQRLLGD